LWGKKISCSGGKASHTEGTVQKCNADKHTTQRHNSIHSISVFFRVAANSTSSCGSDQAQRSRALSLSLPLIRQRDRFLSALLRLSSIGMLRSGREERKTVIQEKRLCPQGQSHKRERRSLSLSLPQVKLHRYVQGREQRKTVIEEQRLFPQGQSHKRERYKNAMLTNIARTDTTAYTAHLFFSE
jgi:hypothetical protein